MNLLQEVIFPSQWNKRKLKDAFGLVIRKVECHVDVFIQVCWQRGAESCKRNYHPHESESAFRACVALVSVRISNNK